MYPPPSPVLEGTLQLVHMYPVHSDHAICYKNVLTLQLSLGPQTSQRQPVITQCYRPKRLHLEKDATAI